MAKQKGCKVRGADIRRFMADVSVWKGKYFEEATFIVDGNELGIDEDVAEVDTGADVVVIGGMMRKDSDFEWEGPSVESALRVWLKRQTHEYVLVEVEKARKGELLEAVKGCGGRVVK